MTENFSSDMNQSRPIVSGIILAGGKSRRMGGVNKALLKIDGRPIVERVRAVLAAVIQNIAIITNTPEEFNFLGLPMYKDLIPDCGSIGGLFTGLSRCSGAHGFIVGCDMPFLNEKVIAHMVSLVGSHDVIIPRIEGRLEPLHAIYSRKCLPHVKDLIANQDLAIINLFPQISLLEVPQRDLEVFDPAFHFIVNINTPEDLQKAQRMVELEKTMKEGGPK